MKFQLRNGGKLYAQYYLGYVNTLNIPLAMLIEQADGKALNTHIQAHP
ncbi:MAG: hypothetical protein ACKV1O_29380 [Saprospiraceae bacterium]